MMPSMARSATRATSARGGWRGAGPSRRGDRCSCSPPLSPAQPRPRRRLRRLPTKSTLLPSPRPTALLRRATAAACAAWPTTTWRGAAARCLRLTAVAQTRGAPSRRRSSARPSSAAPPRAPAGPRARSLPGRPTTARARRRATSRARAARARGCARRTSARRRRWRRAGGTTSTTGPTTGRARGRGRPGRARAPSRRRSARRAAG